MKLIDLQEVSSADNAKLGDLEDSINPSLTPRELDLWEKWKAPGHGFTNIARSQGKLVVDEEDIIIYRRT